jgi:hypothetical protein
MKTVSHQFYIIKARWALDYFRARWALDYFKARWALDY